MSDPTNQAKSIFLAAIEEHAQEQWPGFLDQACAGDVRLRAEVEKLLRSRSELGSFHEPPQPDPFATVDAPSIGERRGTAIGPYKLIEQIGEGGMGTVYMAQQTEPVKRAVAVKIIKAGMDTRQVIARFEAERQALALMDHPNIAKVLDAGTIPVEGDAWRVTGEATALPATHHAPHATPAGRPYFVMELVKGVAITRYCDEHRLTPRQRLELFIPVCQAVQHAHQKGVIHRDLKPSNILVAQYDGRPVPKVIDFGVAKAAGQPLTDKTLMTGFGSLIGTLEYMSPEQAEINQLDIDTRSDIYSLGAVLYELLTGSTPLDRKRLTQAAFTEMLRIIREEEPQKPSTRLSDSTDSLPSISAQRHMEPAKLTRSVRGELDWIVMKALEKDRSRRYETADGFAMDIQRYLADEPVQACPPSAWYRLRKFARRNKTALAVAGLILFFIALLGGGGGWVIRDRAARRAKVGHDLELALDQAELFQGERKRAEALAAVDRAELLAGQAPAHLARYERLAALKERLAAEARDQAFVARFEEIRLRVESQVDVAENHFTTAAAGPEIRDALRSYGIEIGVIAPARAAAYVQSRPEPVRLNLISALDECLRYAPKEVAPTRQWLLATLAAAETDAWRELARKAVAGRDWKALEQLAREADVRKQPPSFLLFVADNLPARMSPTRLELLRRIQRGYPADLWANDMLALELLNNNGQPAEAVRYYTAALALRPDNPGCYFNRGLALEKAGETDEAIADYRQAVALAPQYSHAHHNLGVSLRAKGRLDEAIAEYREAIRIKNDNADAHCNLGNALLNKGLVDDAIAEFREAIRIKNDNADAHCSLGHALRDKGRIDDAIAEFREAIRIKKDFDVAHYNLGNALWAKGRLDEAIAEYRAAIRIKEDFDGAHYNLAKTLRAKGRLDEAIAEYRAAIRIKNGYAEAHYDLGNALLNKGLVDEAIAEFREAIRIKKDFDVAHINLGNALRDKGLVDDAIAEFRAAIRIKKDNDMAHYNLGIALREKGLADGAIAEFREAIRIKNDNADAHYNLGVTLRDKGLVDDAIAEFREAIRIKNDDADVHCNLGDALGDKGRVVDAVAEYKKAIDLQPDYAEAHCNLAQMLRLQGQFSASFDFYKRGHALGSKRSGWHYPSAQWVADAERLVRLEAKLADVLAGKATPTDNRERLGLVEVCRLTRRYLSAARLYADAFTAEPKLADDLKSSHRYDAACFAALAAAGQGIGADKLGGEEQSRLRQRALAWLRADLEQWSKRLEDGKPEDRRVMRATLEHWQRDTDLAGVRETDALKKLLAKEQESWRKLWSDVAELLKKAGNGK